MSSSTETTDAWIAVMTKLAIAHAKERHKIFKSSMEEYKDIPRGNKPVVSPLGVIIAEVIGMLSLLGTEAEHGQRVAAQELDYEALIYFTQIQQQVQKACVAVRDIDVF